MIATPRPLALGQTDLTLTHYQNASSGLVLARLHGDELAASRVGQAWVAENGGEFLDIENEKRNVSFTWQAQIIEFDPNRIFSRAGQIATLNSHACPSHDPILNEVEKFADAYKAYLQDRGAVIALHNNIDFNLGYYLPGGECEASALAVHHNPRENPHDFVIVTQARDYKALQTAGVNVVLENGEKLDFPGSLSAYCQSINLRYFNIETFRGHDTQQQTLLETISRVL